MKISSSKPILSPGRAGVRDQPNSLSTSLSRRLRTSGSIKGGASPAMFPTKKRGNFENPEPSSPKVTCIGQVRVRGKKRQAKKLRSLSRRCSAGPAGEVSFRKLEHSLDGFHSKGQNDKESLNLGSQNQSQECSPAQRSWVHFPVTICEALRAIGSEFSCLIPCRTERGKEEKTVGVEDGNRRGSCGAVFTRWLVAVQDGNGGGERDIELVIGDEEEDEDEDEDEDEEESVVRKSRRHVFEDLEIINGRIGGHSDEGRVSICVPPKNALLLMRCRSDPMKNEDRTNRSWEPSVTRNEEEDEEFVDGENQIEKDLMERESILEVEQQQVMVLDQDQEKVQQVEAKQYQEQENVLPDEAKPYQEQENVQQDEANHDHDNDNVQLGEANQDQEYDNVQQNEVGQYQEHDNVQQYEVGQEQEHDNVQQNEVGQDQEHDNMPQYEVGQDQEHDNMPQYQVGQDQEHENVQQHEVGQDQEHEQTVVEEESFYLVSLFEESTNQDYVTQEDNEANEEDDVAEIVAEESTMVIEFAEISETHEDNNGVLKAEVLPECLLMMIHEPKLSMNVSKETWVCSQDFIKRPSTRRKPPPPPLPMPPAIKPDGGDESSNDITWVADGGFPAVLQQPGRSSCSLPVAPSMATVLEQKLANAVGYEPFVLTRCKSEPMKTAASKLLPESCVWENRKLERLSGAAFGVGAAGLGF